MLNLTTLVYQNNNDKHEKVDANTAFYGIIPDLPIKKVYGPSTIAVNEALNLACHFYLAEHPECLANLTPTPVEAILNNPDLAGFYLISFIGLSDDLTKPAQRKLSISLSPYVDELINHYISITQETKSGFLSKVAIEYIKTQYTKEPDLSALVATGSAGMLVEVLSSVVLSKFSPGPFLGRTVAFIAAIASPLVYLRQKHHYPLTIQDFILLCDPKHLESFITVNTSTYKDDDAFNTVMTPLKTFLLTIPGYNPDKQLTEQDNKVIESLGYATMPLVSLSLSKEESKTNEG